MMASLARAERFVSHRLRSSAIRGVGRMLALALGLLASVALAQQDTAPKGLDERTAVERALERPAFVELASRALERERGRAVAAGAYANPQLLYMREQTFDALGTREDYLTLAQLLDLGGRRRLAREAGEARVQVRALEQRRARVELSTEVRERFYECLFREARGRALRAWSEQIGRALEVVSRRTARGDAAPYDQRRLERERTVALGRLESERALAQAASARLAGLLGAAPDELLEPVGALLPSTDPGDATALLARVEESPTLRAHAQAARAASLDARAAGRMGVPDLRLEAGYKGVDLNAGGRTLGFMAGGGLTLPLFDRGRGLRRAAESEAGEHEAARRLAAQESVAELRAQRALASGLREASVRFRAASALVSADLVRIATAGYEGGEMGMFELLDAYRGAVEDELTALDMELAARRAAIALDRLTGRELP